LLGGETRPSILIGKAMSSTWFEQYEKDYFKEYTESELMNSLSRWHNGSGNLNEIVHHFFERLIYKCRNARHSYGLVRDATPMEAIQNDDFINFILEYMYRHPKLFWKNAKQAKLKKFSDADFTPDDINRFKLYFRMGGAPRKVAVFPPKNVKKVIQLLFPEHDFFESPLNYHDPSCGFGTRAAVGLLMNFNYYGTDPNKELNVKLKEMTDLIEKWGRQGAARIPKSDIRCQGSEVFIPEWEGIMDLSFTSPPYFNLELYSDDGYASTRNYDSYDKWLEEFLYPSIQNSMRYLKPSGYFCLNIKNIPGKPVWDDAFAFVESAKDFEMQDSIQFVPEAKRRWFYTRKDGTRKRCKPIKPEEIMVARKIS
jgi:hypothetical protein